MLGDQPGVTSATVWSLVAEVAGPATPIGVSRYDNGRGHPCWFGRELFGELRQLRSDADLWDPDRATARHPVTQVDAIGNVPPRVETWDDYRRLVSGYNPAPVPSRRRAFDEDTHPTPLPPAAPTAATAPRPDADRQAITFAGRGAISRGAWLQAANCDGLAVRLVRPGQAESDHSGDDQGDAGQAGRGDRFVEQDDAEA